MSVAEAIKAYKRINVESQVEDVNAHKLIEMLLAGALEKLNIAKNAIDNNDVKTKGENLSAAISILEGLKSSLDHKEGGEIASNLLKLYEHCIGKILLANIENNINYILEVIDIILTIKSGWDGIEKEANEILSKK